MPGSGVKFVVPSETTPLTTAKQKVVSSSGKTSVLQTCGGAPARSYSRSIDTVKQDPDI